MTWRNFAVKIRRRETPLYDRIYRIASWVRNFPFPCIKPLHSALHMEWSVRTSIWNNFWRIVYYEPMFKSQCVSVGRNFRMAYAGNGLPGISGDLKISIGANVTILSNIYLAGLKVFDTPELYIGDNTYIGPRVSILVGHRVEIGANCIITSKLITDNPGHSTRNALIRMESGGGSPAKENIRPVSIGDFCFLPLHTFVYPGVTIGDGVVARVGTHINFDVPPFCLVAGNPARIVKKLDIPHDIFKLVGHERYESYLEAHRALTLG